MEPARGLPREPKMLSVTVAMTVFVLSMFMDWFGFDLPGGAGGSVAATEARSWWIALALAVIAGGIFAADALSYPPPTRFASLGVATLAAGFVVAWAVFHAVDGTEGPATLKVGAWVGVIASVVGLGLAVRVWSQERR
jgi:hypothetical protein